MCNTLAMLTKEDKDYITNHVDRKIDELAVLVQSGFKEIIETKADKRDLEETDKKIEKIDYRLDVIEYKLVGGQGRRIERLEDDIRIVKTKIGLQ